MRLFLQRNGKALEAVKYAVMSYTARMRDLKLLLAKGVEVYPSPMGKDEIEKLLKKAKRPELVDAVSSVANKHYGKTPKLDLDAISQDMNDVLRINQPL